MAPLQRRQIPAPRRVARALTFIVLAVGVATFFRSVSVVTRRRPFESELWLAAEMNAEDDNMEERKFVKQSSDSVAPAQRRSACPQYCKTDKVTKIQMVAFPHSASSSTDRLFRAASQAWHNLSLPYTERGFVCPNNETVFEYKTCHSDENALSNVSCILNKFQYSSKIHSNYNRVSRSADKPFTILRLPVLTVMSQYTMRQTWDALWAQEYPGSDVGDVPIEDWVRKAFWRHNLFTKMLATDTAVIWTAGVVRKNFTIAPSKEQSDEENLRGRKSLWFQTVLERLRKMPFFGLHHRLAETFELMGFHFCIPVTMEERVTKKKRMASAELNLTVKELFRLDSLLLQEAEPLFDEMVKDMREKKARGILCDLRSVLGKPDLDTGLQCG